MHYQDGKRKNSNNVTEINYTNKNITLGNGFEYNAKLTSLQEFCNDYQCRPICEK
jgi:hypothetical protein